MTGTRVADRAVAKSSLGPDVPARRMTGSHGQLRHAIFQFAVGVPPRFVMPLLGDRVGVSFTAGVAVPEQPDVLENEPERSRGLVPGIDLTAALRFECLSA